MEVQGSVMMIDYSGQAAGNRGTNFVV